MDDAAGMAVSLSLLGRAGKVRHCRVAGRAIQLGPWLRLNYFNRHALYADRIEMQVSYLPDRVNMPQLVSTAKDIN